ncbi:MAG: ABC-F family ATP-binding cassette domain-containing protein [Chlamydiae bacterium]|nr:ABC-F family ATP-binding cassette domain-containing protein [Chlamydiota bacterium]
MSALLGIHSLSKSYGTQVLFCDISFTVSEGDRIGLVGPNGAGKSTLLKIIMGLEHEDEGHISKRGSLRIGYASQAPEFPSKSLEEVLLDQNLQGDPVELLTRARVLLGKAQFTDLSQNASTLSGGWKKRLDIARALMQEPDLLLLDEPTNHLDIEGILWLEKFLCREKTAYIIISHDRYFLDKVTNKIIELNPCYPDGLFISKGNMSAYTLHKEAFLEGQAEQERSLTSLVRGEIDWLRRSPKARTTKSEARITKANKMIEELAQIKKRNKTEKVNIDFSASERETRKLLVAKNLSKSFGEKKLFSGVDITLSPGTRLGIVGKNGTGKTTLLKVLAGKIPPDMGTLKCAEDLRLVYFDQHREHLPQNISLKEALCPTGDTVNYRGQSIHVNGWAKRFLFPVDRLSMPVKCLSGGEKARILIARLMLAPADLLFLDEPTNDLDIQTLEVIEESLREFPGALVLITHDRCLMDNVCTQILGLGEGNEQQFFADYGQWERACLLPPEKKSSQEKPISEPVKTPTKKLSFKEQKELEGMEKAIMNAEAEIKSLQKQLENPEVHANSQKSQELYHLLAEAEQKLETLFTRWQELEERTKKS